MVSSILDVYGRGWVDGGFGFPCALSMVIG